MEIVWDPSKAKSNYLKHRIYFSDVKTVLMDPYALSRPDPDNKGKERFVTTGCDALGRICTVVYVYRRNTIRLISARKTTKKEKYYYEIGI